MNFREAGGFSVRRIVLWKQQRVGDRGYLLSLHPGPEIFRM